MLGPLPPPPLYSSPPGAPPSPFLTLTFAPVLPLRTSRTPNITPRALPGLPRGVFLPRG